jgi:hypothetical protein
MKLSEDYRKEAMSLLSYEPETGLFRWKVQRNSHGGKVRPGAIAGTPSYGYVAIKVLGRLWRAHRLAWLFMTGDVPPKGMEIDHINGERTDNRWANLRCVTRSQNNYNMGVSRRNVSGVKGVSWVADRGQWLARLKIEGRIVHLSQFDEKERAIAARKEGERRYHGEFARAS